MSVVCFGVQELVSELVSVQQKVRMLTVVGFVFRKKAEICL